MVEDENDTLKCYLLKMLNEISHRTESDMNVNKNYCNEIYQG